MDFLKQRLTAIIYFSCLSAHDRSRSPASQRDESPTRPPPPKESDFKFSNDQQVPSTDQPVLRDANSIALEKLEHIKQNLANLHEQVDAFSGMTRDDRAYKQLDEHAVSLMLRCDELTDVSADIKEKRKEMIRNVQRVIGKLELKVPATPATEVNSNPMEIASLPSINEQPADHHINNEENLEQTKSSSPEKQTFATHPIEQSMTS